MSGGRAGGTNISSGNISFRRVSMPTENKILVQQAKESSTMAE